MSTDRCRCAINGSARHSRRRTGRRPQRPARRVAAGEIIAWHARYSWQRIVSANDQPKENDEVCHKERERAGEPLDVGRARVPEQAVQNEKDDK